MPGAVSSPQAPSPVTFALLADQQQQDNKIIPVEKESPLGPPQQKKTRLTKVLAAAGATALMLAIVFIFMKCAKGYLAKKREEEEKEQKPEDVVDKPKKRPLTQEEEIEKKMIAGEIGFEGEAMTDMEIEAEARKRVARRKEIAEGLKHAAGAEGRTEKELKHRAHRQEHWERAKRRAAELGYELNNEELEREFEEEWQKIDLELEAIIEMKVIGSSIGFEAEAKTDKEMEEEARSRIARRQEIAKMIEEKPGGQAKSLAEIEKAAHREEHRERQKRRAERFGYKPTREDIDKKFREEWERRKIIEGQ